MTVQTGLASLVHGKTQWTKGQQIGLIANPTSVLPDLQHSIDVLSVWDKVNLVRLFCPEHGIRSDAQDMVSVESSCDKKTGLPIHSLYGTNETSLMPKKELLVDLDAVLFDIQDIGSRYYTYVWTLVYMMRVCADLGVEVVVLDRPNPINGIDIEGGLIADPLRSFVGLCPLPNRHGMTVGEIARWANETENINCHLTVIPMQGWSREMFYEDTNLPWVMPSPNMPTRDTALVYPGSCLIEGTEISEGRGTTKPFEMIGAPFIDSHLFAQTLNNIELQGVSFRDVSFTPMFQKHTNTLCHGVQIHVFNKKIFRPYLTGIAILSTLVKECPEQFHWREKPYEFVSDRLAIDLLIGNESIRHNLEQGMSIAELKALWQLEEDGFRQSATQWWLY